MANQELPSLPNQAISRYWSRRVADVGDSPLRLDPHTPRRVAVMVPMHASQDLELRDSVFGPLSAHINKSSVTVNLQSKLLTRGNSQRGAEQRMSWSTAKHTMKIWASSTHNCHTRSSISKANPFDLFSFYLIFAKLLTLQFAPKITIQHHVRKVCLRGAYP